MKLTRLTIVALLPLFVLFSCSSDSEDPAPDVIAPQVNFTIAGDNNTGSSEPSVFSNQIQININAEDAGGIAKVEAFINNEKMGEDTTSPFQITIDISGLESKQASTNKFQDYTLKVTATDKSGNESSTEEIIHIDNQLPSITNVSLEDGSVINGDTNTVTFAVSDNEGLSSVTTYLNNSLLQQITDETYEININTLNLSDGENTLGIQAVDLAGNTTNFDVVFISDNTGPTITLQSLSNN